MAGLDDEALAQLTLLRRQLRDLKGLTESRPGVFTYGGRPFLEFVRRDHEPVYAELRNANSGSAAIMRFATDQPGAQRQLLDEAKRRLAKLTDD